MQLLSYLWKTPLASLLLFRSSFRYKVLGTHIHNPWGSNEKCQSQWSLCVTIWAEHTVCVCVWVCCAAAGLQYTPHCLMWHDFLLRLRTTALKLQTSQRAPPLIRPLWNVSSFYIFTLWQEVKIFLSFMSVQLAPFAPCFHCSSVFTRD